MVLTLEEIYNKSEYWVNSILYTNNYIITDNHMDNLYNVIYILRESGQLNYSDCEIYDDPRFEFLFKASKIDLLNYICIGKHRNNLIVKEANCFAGMTFDVSGKMEGYNRTEFTKLIRDNGGRVAGSVTRAVRYLISTKEDIASNSAKVKIAVKRGVPLISQKFITDSISMGTCLNPNDYIFKHGHNELVLNKFY